MNLSWANQLAKTALKNAQQKIDSVLDIRADEEGTSQAAVVDDTLLLTPVPQDDNDDANTIMPSPTGTAEDLHEEWGSAWGALPPDSEVSQLVVDSEPNPIRDESTPVVPLLDHSPSSNSSDGVDQHTSPSKDSNEFSEIDVNETHHDQQLDSESADDNESDSPTLIRHEPVLPPHPDQRSSRRSSRHDDALTVASSDIEVIRNVDAWSIASSKIAGDGVMSHELSTKSETAMAFQAQLKVAEQRRNELKASNDAMQKSNAQLQQRIVILNQHYVFHLKQNSTKKELEDKKGELAELLEEGRKISDYSAKQSREIRRLKSEMSDLEKIKTERKRFKDEKTEAENTVVLQKEEIESLKGIIKTLETSSDQMKRENNLSAASSEVVQKHIDEQSKRVTELEAELAQTRDQVVELSETNTMITSEMEKLQASKWAERLAGERANESAASVGEELTEARHQIDRLARELRSAQQQLEPVMQEQGAVAETIARANAPLIEEVNDLKCQLHTEQQLAEDADRRSRQAKKELDEAASRTRAADERFSTDLGRLRSELEMAAKRNVLLDQELERTRVDRLKEQSEISSVRTKLQDKINSLQDEFAALQEESNTLRKNLRIFKEENDALKVEAVELKKQRERAITPAPSLPPPTAKREDLPETEATSEIMMPTTPSAFTFQAHPSNAAQVELESMSTQYTSSMKRIGVLEREVSRCQQLESQVKQLQKQLKDLNSQYNELLEVDGERLERIEELSHDIIDLRKLLRDQLIAFADAKVREEQQAKDA